MSESLLEGVYELLYFVIIDLEGTQNPSMLQLPRQISPKLMAWKLINFYFVP